MDNQYLAFIAELKQHIIQSRYMAARLVNREQLVLYYRTGKSLSEKVSAKKWGARVLAKIAEDLQQQLPGLKGFSHSNMKNMRQFYEDYNTTTFGQLLTGQMDISSGSLEAKATDLPIGQLPTVQLDGRIVEVSVHEFQQMFMGVSFTHHMILLNKCKRLDERYFYIYQAAAGFWTVSFLQQQIGSNLFAQRGKLANNFKTALPHTQQAYALQVFRDEYLFDFVDMEGFEDERVFEGKLVADIKNTIMTLGTGFSFIGNQYRVEVDGQEFFIDLLFYNRNLQCLVAFELKKAQFKPEHAGQLNFYLNVLDEKVKLPHENPSIGIILCKQKSNTIVEYAFKNIEKGMGAATFRTTKTLPDTMKGILPSGEDLSKLISKR